MTQVTIVIPTYNRAGFLVRAIKSVLNQSYKDFVLQVYDNASTDNTPDLVRDLMAKDSRIEYIRRPHNVGPQGNFVDALSHIKTPYFGFTCDDDYYLPWFIEESLAKFADHPEIGAVCGAVPQVKNNVVISTPMESIPSDGVYNVPDALRLYAQYYMLSHQGILARREVGGVRDNVGFQIDKDFYLRLLSKWPVYLTKRPLAISIRHGESHGEDPVKSIYPWTERVFENFMSEPGLDEKTKREVLMKLEADFIEQIYNMGVVWSYYSQYNVADDAIKALREKGCPNLALRVRMIKLGLQHARPAVNIAIEARRAATGHYKRHNDLHERYAWCLNADRSEV